MKNNIAMAAALVAAAYLTACTQHPAPASPDAVADTAATTAATAAQAPAAQPPAAQPPAEARPASASVGTVSTVDAAGVKKLLEGAKGKAAVVNLWATWCPPCVEEMPYFAKLYSEYKDKGVELISISADGANVLEKTVKPFLEKNAIPFPVHVLDETNVDAMTEVLGKELSGALPETLFYDKEGKLVRSHEGGLTYEQLEEAVKPLL